MEEGLTHVKGPRTLKVEMQPRVTHPTCLRCFHAEARVSAVTEHTVQVGSGTGKRL